MSTKNSKIKASKKKVYESEKKAVGSPVPMTQEEVDVMAFGEKSTKVLISRIRSHSIAGFTAKRTIVKLQPVTISAGEMAKLSESGTIPRALKNRIEKSSGETSKRTPRAKASKAEPVKAPPFKK